MKRDAHARLYTADEFRAEARKPGGAVLPLRKEVSGEAKPNAEDAQALDFVLSTATADRANDVVAQDGWRLDNYRKNPVMLWAHDYAQLPVGKPALVGVEGGQLVARGVQFPARELYEHGWTVGEMYRKGFLHAVSVGFAPIKYAWNEERGGYATDFMEQELLEFSAVPVPANPEALISAKAAGLPMAGFIEWAERILDMAEKSDEPSLAVTRPWAEQLYRAAKGDAPRIQVPGEDWLARFEKASKRLAKSLDRHTEALTEAAAPSPAPAKALAVPVPVAAPKSAPPNPQALADAIGLEVARRLAEITGRKP